MESKKRKALLFAWTAFVAFDRSLHDRWKARCKFGQTVEAIDQNNYILCKPYRWSRLFTAYLLPPTTTPNLLLRMTTRLTDPPCHSEMVARIPFAQSLIVHGGEPQQGYRFLDVRARVRGISAWTFPRGRPCVGDRSCDV